MEETEKEKKCAAAPPVTLEGYMREVWQPWENFEDRIQLDANLSKFEGSLVNTFAWFSFAKVLETGIVRFNESNYFKRIGALQTAGALDQDVQVVEHS